MKTIAAPSIVIALLAIAALATPRTGLADEKPYPQYKPSTRSPAALDIRGNAYGASADAPQALSIGDRAPDFSAPRSGGGLVSLRSVRKQGPVVLIFYRGHW
jgi:hypothetical protein